MRAAIAVLALFVLSCEPSGRETVVVYTSVDEPYAIGLFAAFERESGVKVLPVFDTEEAKTLGLVHRILAERARPQADVFWSGDCARSALLKKEGVLEPYRSPSAETIGAEWRDPDAAWTGFGARARVIVYNTRKVSVPPRRLADLAGPDWKGRVALANPLFGTTAAHVAALAQSQGEAAAIRLFVGLRENGARIVGGNSHVRDLVARGDCDAGLTDSDDVWIGKGRGDPIELVYPDQDGAGTLLIPNSAALLKGAPRAANGRRFLDWLLRPQTEALLARGPSRQLPVRPEVSDDLSKIRAMRIDWGRLADSEALLGRLKGALGP